MDRIYSDTARAFDAIAPGYDLTFGPEANEAMGWMRSENLALLQSTFSTGAKLIEIGCGTGDEALALAEAGYEVTATDISKAMVSHTRAKAKAADLSEMIKSIAVPAGQLGQLELTSQFDGAYASFGVLNCEPDLEALAASLASLLKAGSRFVCTFMPRFSPFEMAWFLSHMRFSLASRRINRDWQQTSIRCDDGVQVDVAVRYLSAADIIDSFSPHFKERRRIGLGLVIPPPYLDALYRRRKRLWEFMMPIEKGLRERRPWKSIGDHVILVLERT